VSERKPYNPQAKVEIGDKFNFRADPATYTVNNELCLGGVWSCIVDRAGNRDWARVDVTDPNFRRITPRPDIPELHNKTLYLSSGGFMTTARNPSSVAMCTVEDATWMYLDGEVFDYKEIMIIE
jgi:hypothetical protein